MTNSDSMSLPVPGICGRNKGDHPDPGRWHGRAGSMPRCLSRVQRRLKTARCG